MLLKFTGFEAEENSKWPNALWYFTSPFCIANTIHPGKARLAKPSLTMLSIFNHATLVPTVCKLFTAIPEP